MFPGVTLLVFVALVAIYLLGTFLTQGEKSETYLDAAAIVGMMGIFFAGKTLSLLLFMSILVLYVGLLFAIYYFRLFKKGVRPSFRNRCLDILFVLAIFLAKDIFAVSVVCVAYLLVERGLFYRKFHSLL